MRFGRQRHQGRSRGDGRSRGGAKLRLIIAGAIGLVSLVSFMCQSQQNPITGENQRVRLTPRQEVLLGLEAAPSMMKQHGGLLPDQAAQDRVDLVGSRLLAALEEHLAAAGKGTLDVYQFEFHLLSDSQIINAFALPGGQVFITAALYNQLETEGQLAGVLGHEVGHVIERHGAQRLAKQKLTQGLVGAAGVAGGDVDSARMAQAIGSMINMKYGREDELESDVWGVRLCASAGYDPRAMMGVMKILDEASKGNSTPEILSTHPKPANRAAYVEKVIAKEFPNGLSDDLRP
jgi:beta-barrel assembly-enhancing protease